MEVWVVCTVVPLGLNWRLYVLCTVGLEVLCSVASVNHLREAPVRLARTLFGHCP